MAEGNLELEFTTTGAAKVLETIELIRKNAKSATDMSPSIDRSTRKQGELVAATKRAAVEAEKKAQAERMAATQAERAATANERSANASARTNPTAMAQTSGGIAGGLSRGGVEIKGVSEFRASSETISNAIRGAGVVMAAASVALNDSSNALVQATGRISSLAGMGWGIGQGFGAKGGMIGAAFGIGWGVGSELANWLYQDENETEEGKARLQRLRDKNRARNEARFEQAKFDRTLSKVSTADEAKSLVSSLEDQLAEARMKFENGLDGEGTMQERQAKITAIENRLKAAQEIEANLDRKERGKAYEARLNRISEIERNAGTAAEKQNWQNAFEEASSERKIEMLNAKLVENARTLSELNDKFMSSGMTDEEFQTYSDRYRTAQDEKVSLQNQIRKQRLELEKERKEAAKKAAEESKAALDKRAGDIASEYNKAQSGYNTIGTELQRAGIAFGGTASLQVSVLQATAESVKSILQIIETGTLDVAVKNKQPIVS